MVYQEKVRELQRFSDGKALMTKAEYMKFAGVGRDAANSHLRGLEKVFGKYYFIKDIAKRMEGKL